MAKSRSRSRSHKRRSKSRSRSRKSRSRSRKSRSRSRKSRSRSHKRRSRSHKRRSRRSRRRRSHRVKRCHGSRKLSKRRGCLKSVDRLRRIAHAHGVSTGGSQKKSALVARLRNAGVAARKLKH